MVSPDTSQKSNDAPDTKSLLEYLQFIKYDYYVEEVKPSNFDFPIDTDDTSIEGFSEFGLHVIGKFLHIGVINESTFIENLDSNRVLLIVWPSFVSPTAYSTADHYLPNIERVNTIMFIVPDPVFRTYAVGNVLSTDIILSTATLTSTDEWKFLEGLVLSSLCDLLVDRNISDSVGNIDIWTNFPVDKLNTALEQLFFICCGQQSVVVAVEKLLQRNWDRIVTCSLHSEEGLDREESVFVQGNLFSTLIKWTKLSRNCDPLVSFLNDVNFCDPVLEPDEIMEIATDAFATNVTNYKRYQCGDCTYQTNERQNYRRHLMTHTGEKIFKCEECSKTFAESASLKIHKIIHSGKYNYLCKYCGKSFYSSNRLKLHLMYHHLSDPKYQCYACDLSFQNEAELKEHMASHANDVKYQCLVCLRRFDAEIKLKEHSRIHTEERPFKCPICGGGFFHKHHLREHSMLHTDVPHFECDVCGKKFKQSSGLRKHRVSRHQVCAL